MAGGGEGSGVLLCRVQGVVFIAAGRQRSERMVWGSGGGAGGTGGVRASMVGDVQREGGTGAVPAG